MGALPAGHLEEAAVVATLRPATPHIDGVPLAIHQVLEVLPSLQDLFPMEGLQRGSTVIVNGGHGGTSLLLALLAAPLVAGGWGAVIGQADLGFEAAHGLSLPLERLVVVPDPGKSWLEVSSVLFDACDLVVVVPPYRCRPREARRLTAQARERGAVLIIFVPSALGDHGSGASLWPEPGDIWLESTSMPWPDLTSTGHLLDRQIEVVATGRRAAHQRRRVPIVLPNAQGGVGAISVLGSLSIVQAGSLRSLESR